MKDLDSLWRSGDFIAQSGRHPQCVSQWNGTLGDSEGGLGLKTGEEASVCPWQFVSVGESRTTKPE